MAYWKKSLPCDNKLLPLKIFLDTNVIIRVESRIWKHSYSTYGQKHPILLTKIPKFANKLIMYYHVINIHIAPQLQLSFVPEKNSFVKGRWVVHKQHKKCLKCLRLNLTAAPQLMGDISTTRIMGRSGFGLCWSFPY